MGDYKERLKEEYKQTKHRLIKLRKYLYQVKRNEIDEPKCPISIYENQLYHMRHYLECLEMRAEFDDIDLGY